MKWFSYHCRHCGDFDVDGVAEDSISCRCGRTAKRKYQIGVIASSLKHSGRWDPVVGAYVENDGQFKSLLHKGQDEQAEKLNMDVVLKEIDARDSEGISELHGWDHDQRQADIERSPK